ncbi:hypothetical protein MLM_1330 [Mycobacterium lepraemurium]|nr:hypothetical protein MLM_1330 [Mycobacterium lepraemurium]
MAGAVIDGVSDVVRACGVLATVESPEPHPVSVTAIKATAAEPVSGSVRYGGDHTSTHRTVIAAAGVAGAAGVARLCPRSRAAPGAARPLESMGDDPPGQLD